MRNDGNNGNTAKSFRHKSLLIYSGVCLAATLIFLTVLGCAVHLLDNSIFIVLCLLIIDVPLVTHCFLWGKFFEWKRIKGLPILFYILTAACATLPVVVALIPIILSI